jgi:hypothetical protein
LNSRGSVSVPDGSDVRELVAEWDNQPAERHTAALKIRAGTGFGLRRTTAVAYQDGAVFPTCGFQPQAVVHTTIGKDHVGGIWFLLQLCTGIRVEVRTLEVKLGWREHPRES